MPAAVAKLMRFGASGAITTAISYVMFVVLIRLHLHYLIASALGWIASVTVSYGLHRRITFQVRTQRTLGEVATFVGGYLGQLLLASTLYALLIGVLKLGPTPAFLINLVATSIVSFTYMNGVVFKGSRPPPKFTRDVGAAASPQALS